MRALYLRQPQAFARDSDNFRHFGKRTKSSFIGSHLLLTAQPP
jgi:hypothetical protein